MKIYLGHASSFDYREDFYAPIQSADLGNQFEFIFPHAFNNPGVLSKDIILNCDGMIAEVSYPSTGLGIELAWAIGAKVPTFCVAKRGSNPSSSLQHLGLDICWYDDKFSLVNHIKTCLMNLKTSIFS